MGPVFFVKLNIFLNTFIQKNDLFEKTFVLMFGTM